MDINAVIANNERFVDRYPTRSGRDMRVLMHTLIDLARAAGCTTEDESTLIQLCVRAQGAAEDQAWSRGYESGKRVYNVTEVAS